MASPSGRVTSDLHLFSPRVDDPEIQSWLTRELGDARLLVLNGDTFDFRWSRFREPDETLRQALQWVDGLLADHDQLEELHYVLGNHDCWEPFVQELRVRARAEPRLRVHASHFRRGDRLFLHGDVANLPLRPIPMNRRRFMRHRQRWASGRRWPAMLHGLHRGWSRLPLESALLRTYFPPRRAVHRVHRYLEATDPRELARSAHVHFGHTHEAFENLEFQGRRYHNTGAAMPGYQLRMDAFPVKTRAVEART